MGVRNLLPSHPPSAPVVILYNLSQTAAQTPLDVGIEEQEQLQNGMYVCTVNGQLRATGDAGEIVEMGLAGLPVIWQNAQSEMENMQHMPRTLCCRHTVFMCFK